jgi:hypothetical protein
MHVSALAKAKQKHTTGDRCWQLRTRDRTAEPGFLYGPARGAMTTMGRLESKSVAHTAYNVHARTQRLPLFALRIYNCCSATHNVQGFAHLCCRGSFDAGSLSVLRGITTLTLLDLELNRSYLLMNRGASDQDLLDAVASLKEGRPTLEVLLAP